MVELMMAGMAMSRHILAMVPSTKEGRREARFVGTFTCRDPPSLKVLLARKMASSVVGPKVATANRIMERVTPLPEMLTVTVAATIALGVRRAEVGEGLIPRMPSDRKEVGMFILTIEGNGCGMTSPQSWKEQTSR